MYWIYVFIWIVFIIFEFMYLLNSCIYYFWIHELIMFDY